MPFFHQAKRRSGRNTGAPRKKYNDDIDFGLSDDEELTLPIGGTASRPKSGKVPDAGTKAALASAAAEAKEGTMEETNGSRGPTGAETASSIESAPAASEPKKNTSSKTTSEGANSTAAENSRLLSATLVMEEDTKEVRTFS